MTPFTIIFSLILLMAVLLTFSRQIHAAIVRVQTMNTRHAGVKVLTSQNFYDVNTGQNFQVWRGVGGLRLAVVSLLLKA